MSRAGRVATASIAAALLLAGGTAAAEQRASLTDIEDEVMCPICGTLLELSDAPQAQRERAFIRRLIAEGRSKGEIKDTLVAEYGPAVLATPEDSGFDLAAYVVPIVAFALAALAVALGVGSWRRRARRTTPEQVKAPEGEDAERLESDLAHYDL
jgi:cytochrome c-type biogenesis protein CcmH/NrfF